VRLGLGLRWLPRPDDCGGGCCGGCGCGCGCEKDEGRVRVSVRVGDRDWDWDRDRVGGRVRVRDTCDEDVAASWLPRLLPYRGLHGGGGARPPPLWPPYRGLSRGGATLLPGAAAYAFSLPATAYGAYALAG